MGSRSINRFTKTNDTNVIEILFNFALLLFDSTIVLTIGNKSNFICKIHIITLP